MLFKLTVRSGYAFQVTVRDTTSGILVPGDLEAFLHRLMTQDVVEVSGMGAGLIAGGLMAGPTYGLGVTGAAWAIGQAGLAGTAIAGAFGTVVGISCGVYAVSGGVLLGGFAGLRAHEHLWAYPFHRKRKKVCDSINSHDLGRLAV